MNCRIVGFLTTVAGEHTRTIQIATPTIGGLMKFAVKTVTCLGCKTPLRGSKSKQILRSWATARLIPQMALCARTVDLNFQNFIKDR